VTARPRSSALIASGLALAALVVFWPATSGAFVNYDDNVYVTENPRVKAGLTAEGIGWSLTTFRAGNWHPVTWWSHMADVSVWGLDPRGHHGTSVAIHAGAVALLFLLLERTTGAAGRSAAAAALFGLHPLRVESVAWVAERKDVLSAALGLAAILAYVFWTERPSKGRYAAVVALYALSLASKPMLVTLPVLLLLLDRWPLSRRSYRDKVPLAVLALASSGVTLVAQHAGGAVATTGMFSLGVRVENAIVATATYAIRTAWPSGLAVFYPHPERSLPAATVAGAAFLVAGGAALAWRERRRRPYLATGFGWFAVALVPVIGIVQVGSQAMADRYTYLPSIGLVIALVWAAAELVPRRGAQSVAATAAAVALALATRTQIGHWKDSQALFSRAAAVTEGNFVAHVNLGAILRERGDLAGSLAQLQEATRIAPSYGKAWYQLGMTLQASGRTADAGAAYARALSLDPGNAEIHFDRGVLLSEAGETDAAIAEFAEACRLDPSLARAHYNWGTALAAESRLPEAIERFRRAVELAPDYPEAHYNLGAAALLTGDVATARREIGIARSLGYEPPPQVMEMLGRAR
jgi:tetratricopeptide (TPR) repeat protein